MPRPTAAGRDQPCKADAGAKTDAAETIAPPEVTVESTLSNLETARQAAMSRGHIGVAVNATLAMARLRGLFRDGPGRSSPAAPKFDGNYYEAARRIARLLQLGKDNPAKAGRKNTKRQADKARDRST